MGTDRSTAESQNASARPTGALDETPSRLETAPGGVVDRRGRAAHGDEDEVEDEAAVVRGAVREPAPVRQAEDDHARAHAEEQLR